MPKKVSPVLPIVGWREWVALPDYGVEIIKAKVDTGARSSSLHAFNLKVVEKNGVDRVSFEIHPMQRTNKKSVTVEADVVEFRSVRSSNGKSSVRPVIVTSIKLMGITWSVELTLANRDEMGFRMLIGREAIRHRFLVNPGVSYCSKDPARRKKKKKAKKINPTQTVYPQ